MKNKLNKLTSFASCPSLNLNRFMKFVVFNFGKHDQIFKSVVRFNSINMMDVLVRIKICSKMLFHNKSMFSDPPGTSPNFDVTEGLFSFGANRTSMNAPLPKRIIRTLLSNGQNFCVAAMRAIRVFLMASQKRFKTDNAYLCEIFLPSFSPNPVFLKLNNRFSPNTTLFNKTGFNGIFNFHSDNYNTIL